MSRDGHNSEAGYNRATFLAMILLERGCEADIVQSLLRRVLIDPLTEAE